ncbi:MAG TPA: DUF1573 domain-containing protein [Bacillota bacterium]|nr:DUF1573 domain-containing protein [Bacillota bacterium]
MKSGQNDSFQEVVEDVLIRHRSVLDVVSKLQECSAKVNRATMKSVTSCGCLQINATRQVLPEDASFLSWKTYTQTHLTGELCPRCREILETEIGQAMFYTAALCNLLNLDLNEIIEKEQERVNALGPYSLA